MSGHTDHNPTRRLRPRVNPGRWHRFVGSVLLGWLVLLTALLAVGCPLELAWFVSAFGIGAIGFPLLCRARVAALVAVAAVLAVGVGAGFVHRAADGSARRYVEANPPPPTPTTTHTFVVVDRSGTETRPGCDVLNVVCESARPFR